MLKAGNNNTKMWNHKLKVAGIMMGICLLTGSLCACGDDSDIVISLEELIQADTEESGENVASATLPGSDNAHTVFICRAAAVVKSTPPG